MKRLKTKSHDDYFYPLDQARITELFTDAVRTAVESIPDPRPVPRPSLAQFPCY